MAPEATISSPNHPELYNTIPEQSLTKPVFDLGSTPCFVFWQEVMACYVLNTSGDTNKGAEKCVPAFEDYHECLHHKKEVRSPLNHSQVGVLIGWYTQAERIGKLTQAYRKWESEHPEMKKKTAGEIRRLGVIEATMEEKNLHVPKWLPYKKI
jgi:NADH dehydrogenase (ubiquinone) Fe-S protein 5